MADFKALQSELDGVLAKVNTWSASKEKNLSDLKVSHNTFLDTQNEYTNELKQREKQAKIKMEKLSQASTKSQQILMEIQGEVEELSNTSNILPLELANTKKQLEADKENYNEEEQELDICQRSRELKRMNLETGHGVFEKNLALRFERQAEGSLVVKMHNIDPADPKRQFYFSVRVEDDTNLYNVADCVPAVEGLAALVDQLNASNNLSLFVRRVRKAWVDALSPPRAGRTA